MTPRRPWPDLLLGALAVVLLGATLGLARNHAVAEPLPLLQAWRPPLPHGSMPATVDLARRLMDAGALFVDAREPVRYAEGHVAGAINLPADEFDRYPPGRGLETLLFSLRAAPAVVVYCDGPECRASDELAVRLARNGVYNLRIMVDGWPAWEAAGLPAVTGR